MELFNHLFNKYILRTYKQGIVVNSGGKVFRTIDKTPVHMYFSFWRVKRHYTGEQMNKAI